MSMFTMPRLFLPILLLAGLPLILAACGGATPDPAAVRTLVVSQGSDLLTLDPHFILESPTFSIQRNIFEPLTDIDADLKLVPCLAESWEHTGEREWIFRLRRGVTFHDGNPFTAGDAAWTMRRALEWPRSRVRSEVQTVERAEAIDDHTLRIITRIPDAILPLRLSNLLMLDRESSEPAIAAHGDDWLYANANGTGPYRVEQWRKDQHCILAAVENHWDGVPEVKRMRFIAASEDASRMMALRRGEIDILVNVPPRQVESARAMAGYRVESQPGLRLIYLGLDVGREQTPGFAAGRNPLLDPRVREAILLGIDNRLIARAIMGGNAEPADQLFPVGVIGHIPDFSVQRPNLERARALLAEAGWPEGFQLRLDGPNDRYVNDAQILQAVATQLARIGIRVQVNAQPKAQFFNLEKSGRCSFFLIGWSNTNGDGAYTFDHLLHTAVPERGLGDSNNSTNYSNPELDRLTEAASMEFDLARREQLLQQAGRIAMTDLPHIPLHFQMDIYAVSERIDWTPRRDTQIRGRDIRWRP